MKCPKCGSENKDDALYCSLCYNVLVSKTPFNVKDYPRTQPASRFLILVNIFLSRLISYLLKFAKTALFAISGLILLIVLLQIILMFLWGIKPQVTILRREIKPETETVPIEETSRPITRPPTPIQEETKPVIIPITRIPDPIRDTYLDSFEKSIISNYAQETAVENLKRILYIMFKDADTSVLQRMVNNRVCFVIIPKNSNLTDLPQFFSLKGQKTADGRAWDTMRGIGSLSTQTGDNATAIAEENLVGAENNPAIFHYPTYFTAVHEIGHQVMFNGLPAITASGIPSASDIEELFAQCHGNTGVGYYADTNAQEMFAEGVTAYFGVNYIIGSPSEKLLKEANAPLYNMLQKIFGPPKNIPIF